jgi:hypothetical protein
MAKTSNLKKPASANTPAAPSHPFKVGSCYFIRTVTYHLIGRVRETVGKFLVLEDASWVADSGRFCQAIIKGVLNEVEPVEVAFVNLDSITDAFPWNFPAPREQK